MNIIAIGLFRISEAKDLICIFLIIIMFENKGGLQEKKGERKIEGGINFKEEERLILACRRFQTLPGFYLLRSFKLL